MHVRRALLLVAAVLAALFVSGAIHQRLANAADLRDHPPPGVLVEMGGYRLHLYCSGQGTPTVILVAGGGDSWAVWDPVQRGLEQKTRVCSYDRPGLGSSDFYPGPEPGAAEQAAILHELMVKAGEKPPFIVVGHSLGGVLAREFVEQHASEVVGLVLVESSVEGQYSELPSAVVSSSTLDRLELGACGVGEALGLTRLLGLGETQSRAFPLLSAEARAAVAASFDKTGGCAAQSREDAMASEAVTASGTTLRSLGDLPLVVISRGLTEDQVDPTASYSPERVALFAETQAAWLRIQSRLPKLSSRSTWVIASHSGHRVPTTEPGLVVGAVVGLIGGR